MKDKYEGKRICRICASSGRILKREGDKKYDLITCPKCNGLGYRPCK